MADNRGLLGDSWAFTEALGEGVWDAGTGTVKGLGDLAKGGYELATEANARESAWETTKQLADAAAEGRSAEFFGDMAGGALFEVGSILVPAGLVAKAGKLGKVASVADDVADAAKTAKKVENAEEVFGATQKAKAASVNPVIKEFDDKVSPIQRCPVADVGVKNVGATFEGGLYRSVPEGRNPLEIHPVFNKEKAIHRYTGEGQGGLYLGSSQRIVNSEFTGNGASIEGLINNQYNVKIDNLLDLTNPAVRNDLGVSLDDLVRTGGTKEWRYEITNPLGRYAEDSGFNGVIAPATQADGGINVILFNSDLVK